MENKKIIIAGGTGFIGRALAERWGRDNSVIVLTRQSLTARGKYNIDYRHWDGRTVERHWVGELEGADLVLNLAGRSVNCRYTARNRQDISDSRADATRALGQVIREAVVPPKLWVNGSSATIYRHAQDRPQDEYTGEIEDDFSVRVCKRWEKTFEEQRTPFTRKVALRLAITLDKDGPMVRYTNLVKFGLGGQQGSGRQMFSWVHIEDVARAIEWFLDHSELEGTYNLSSPMPVTNRFFMSTLRKTAGRRFGLPMPAPLLKLGAALIGTETELLLKSRWVVPTRLLQTGFRFRYEKLEEAVCEITDARADEQIVRSIV
ncbi:MAG TPA: TIGR01777 family oxidoreductase [Puia sp.]|uniref:TIGR01777 family oxidoreductase n=1 Tax=Puia sp. TaxID=2045100 RepID=UPI002BE0106D|nr:TIGR01777 family oxidoreductase [Puia sp.]HVU99231.1 TIGR01777 family oxidoreductase [Puia sp.]